MSARDDAPEVWGMLGEFESPDRLRDAARAARQAGYRRVEAYSPFPIHGLAEELGLRLTILPVLVFLGGCAGAALGFYLQYWISVEAYPLNVGGRPLNSWPAFLVPTFEATVLFAAGTAVLGMLALNRLPQPHHPVFNAKRFALASRDRFFLCIESSDARYHSEGTRRFFERLEARGVTEIEV